MTDHIGPPRSDMQLTEDSPGSLRNAIAFWAVAGAAMGVFIGLTDGMSVRSLGILVIAGPILFSWFGYMEYHREGGTPFISGGVWLARAAAVAVAGLILLAVFLSIGASILLMGLGALYYFASDVRTPDGDSWSVELRLREWEGYKRGMDGVKQAAKGIAQAIFLIPLVIIVVLSGIALFNQQLISLLS